MMKLFGELISKQLQAEEEHAESRAALMDANQTAVLREQFIAALGHDLRNPLGAIVIGAETLEASSPDERTRRTVQRIRSSAARISGLVNDLLDFARGRLGGGMPLQLAAVDDFENLLRDVLDELPESGRRTTIVTSGLSGSLRCDRDRVFQALSNLVANALQHSGADELVTIESRWTEGALIVAVTNGGAPIPAERMTKIFEPYQRGEGANPHTGLGLGLYIVGEIARAHDGNVECCSSKSGTTFTLTLPRDS